MSSSDVSVRDKESSPLGDHPQDLQDATVPETKKTEISKHLGAGFLCSLIGFGGFVFGWDTGTVGSFVNMPDFIQRFGQISGEGNPYLSKVRVGLMIAIFNIGCAIGGVTLGRTGDLYGRKKGLMMTMVVYIVGIIIQIASVSSWVQYFIGRIVSGLAVGSIAVLAPMFISETSPKAIRGTLVSVYQLMITAGIFLGYCTCYGTYHNYDDSKQWRIPLGLCFAWALLMMFGMTFTPESPRYLAENGDYEEAKISIARANSSDADSTFVAEELEKIVAGVEAEKAAGNASWKELFTGQPKIFYRLFVGVMMQSLQQLTGDNYFFYYGTSIFKSVGLNDSFETAIVLGIVNFASTFLALYVIDHFGRRKTLLTGSACMAVCLLIFACIGVKNLYVDGYGSESRKPVGDAMIFLSCFFIFFFATTWAPGAFVVLSESFPTRIRSKGMAIASAANWIWGFLIAFFTPFISNAIHFAYGFVFFGCLVFSFFFVFAFVPETKGLSLEEVDELYRNYTPGLAFMNTFHKEKTEEKIAQENVETEESV